MIAQNMINKSYFLNERLTMIQFLYIFYSENGQLFALESDGWLFQNHPVFFSFISSFLLNIRVQQFNKISKMQMELKEDPERLSRDPDLIQGLLENPEVVNPDPREPTPELIKKYYIEKVGIIEPESFKKNKAQNRLVGLKHSQNFVSQFTVNVLEYDAESLFVQLLYGNFKKKVSVIITEIQIKFDLKEEGRGQYGSVFFYKDGKIQYIFKAIDVVIKDGRLDLSKIYREFFMTCLASQLQVGPKMLNFFKYDIVIINNKAWFSMEKCTELKPTMKGIEAELIHNMKTLHSVGFMHLDIKPDNVAFSSNFNRVVFIDFGFSQLIEEPFGFKTLSKYSGTLAFCSQEMRTLYYLEGRKYVDLYYNDLVCLQRTLKEILGYNKIALIIAQKIQDQEVHCQQLKQEGLKKSYGEFIFLTVMIRLKYYIFIQEVVEIIREAEENPQLCYSIFSVLSSEYLKESISKDERIKLLVAKLKNRLIQSSFKVTYLDEYFMKMLNGSRRTNLCPNMLSIYHILQLPKIKFTYFATNTLELQKLFFVLNPMSSYFPKEKSNDMLISICNLRRKIIEKIFQFLGKAQADTIFYEIVSEVTHYFYEKLGPLKNREILMALRAMFILLYDPIFVELDLQLVQITSQKTVRLLTGMEFQLLKRITMLPIKQKQKTNSRVFAAMLQLSTEQFQYYSKNCSEALVLKLLGYNNKNQIFQNCDSRQQVGRILDHIRSLSGQTFEWAIYQNIQNTFKQDNDFSSQFMHKLYSVLYKKQRKEPIYGEESDFAYFCKIYKKLEIHEQDSVNPNKLKRTVRKMLEVSTKLGVLYPYFLFFQFSDHFRDIQKKVFEQTQIFVSILNYLRSQRNHFEVFFYASVLMKFLRLYFERFGHFATDAKEPKEISQKLLETYFEFEAGSKKGMYQINSSDDLAAVKTLEVLILLLKQNQDLHILQKLDELTSQFLLNPSRQNQYSYSPFMFMIGHIFSHFELKTEHVVDKFILELTESCIKREAFWNFQIQYLYLQLPIAVYNRLMNYERSYQIIKLFIQKVKFGRPCFNMGYQWICIKQSAFHFCRTAQIYFIENKYNEAKHMPCAQTSPEEAYLQFFLFYRTYCILGMDDKSAIFQVLRLLRILMNAHPFVKETVMPLLFRVLRKCKLHKSKRKEMICLRRQRNFGVLCDAVLRQIEKNLKSKTQLDKIRKKLRKLRII